MLTVAAINGAKATGKPYKLADADGLYLYVSAVGGKSWRYNHAEGGRQKTRTYGRYPLLSLAEARKLHHDFKYSLADAAGMTFEAVAEKWMRLHLPKLQNAKHVQQIGATLERFAYPALGKLPIASIKRRELVAVVQAVDERGTVETAHRVAGRIKQVFDHAIDLGEIEANPATGLTRVLRKPEREPMKALPFSELPQLLRAIDTYGEPVTRIGLMLLAHTFVRTRELTEARRSELDLKAGVWVIPAKRMKMRVPHVVPLSPQVLALIAQLPVREYLIESPKRPGHPVSENTLLFALYRLGYRGRMTSHGFRSIASTALNLSGLWRPEAIERQLAHKESDDVRAAYNRAEYFDERVKMMGWWSEQLAAQTA